MPWAVHSFCCRAEYKVITKSCIRWCWPNQKWFMWPWQYNVFSSVWKYSVCCKCLGAPCCHGYSCLGVYVERGDIHHAHSSYSFLAEALHAVQVLSLARTAGSLGLSSVSSIAFLWKKGSRYCALYKALFWVVWQCWTGFRGATQAL